MLENLLECLASGWQASDLDSCPRRSTEDQGTGTLGEQFKDNRRTILGELFFVEDGGTVFLEFLGEHGRTVPQCSPILEMVRCLVVLYVL